VAYDLRDELCKEFDLVQIKQSKCGISLHDRVVNEATIQLGRSEDVFYTTKYY
jgi:hypothetical protein